MFNGKNKAITLSFDDGVTQDIRLIEILNKYGLKCTFNLNSGRFEKEKILCVDGVDVLHKIVKREDVKYIYDGHEVAAHTVNHPSLPKIEEDGEIIRQVEEDRLALSEIVGYEVVGMAYPGGGVNHDQRVADIIANNTGIKYARTITASHSFDIQSDLLKFKPTLHFVSSWETTFKTAKEFVELETDTPKLLYVWGHAYEFDCSEKEWERFEEFCSIVSGREDIFYGTNREVLL